MVALLGPSSLLLGSIWSQNIPQNGHKSDLKSVQKPMQTNDKNILRKWLVLDPKMVPKPARRGDYHWPEPPLGPLWLKIAPSLPQAGPKMAPRWPKMPQDGPKMLRDSPKMPQDGPKMAPSSPKMAPRWPQDNPKMPLAA